MQHVNYGEDAFIVIGGADNAWVDRIWARDLTPRGTKLYDAIYPQILCHSLGHHGTPN